MLSHLWVEIIHKSLLSFFVDLECNYGKTTLVFHKKKTYTLGSQKSENKPSEPKNGIWAPLSCGHVIYPSIGNFIWSRKKYTFGGQKGENKQSEPKNGI
jgi:hypothetical protein